VAEKVTGEPASDPEVAVSVFAPAVMPRVHEVRVAIPDAFVVTADAGRREPPPEATAKVTETPATTLPPESVTRTDGAIATALPAVAVWLLPALTAIVAAEPAPVGCTVVVTEVSPDDAKVSVWVVDESPAKVTPEKVAVPDVAVTVVVPPRVPVAAVSSTDALEEETVLP
jgi:hypothetical protein